MGSSGSSSRAITGSRIEHRRSGPRVRTGNWTGRARPGLKAIPAARPADATLPPMPLTLDHLAELRALLGDDGVLASEAARFTYEADALTLERFMPDVVALPR